MTAPRRTACRVDFPCTLAIVALAVIATAASFASPRIADLLVCDGRIAHGQLWRALTGPFVHATWGHLIRDLVLVVLAGVGYEAPLRARRGWLYGAGIVLPGLAVLVTGAARWYCGLSGLSHAVFAAALSYEAIRRRGAARVVAVVFGVLAAAKPIYELVTGAPAFPMPLGDGLLQVSLAHVVGVAVGIVAGLTAIDPRGVASGRGDPPHIEPQSRVLSRPESQLLLRHTRACESSSRKLTSLSSVARRMAACRKTRISLIVEAPTALCAPATLRIAAPVMVTCHPL